MLGWPRISVYERKDFRLRIGFRNGHTKIVNLLSAVGGWARNHNSHRRTNSLLNDVRASSITVNAGSCARSLTKMISTCG